MAATNKPFVDTASTSIFQNVANQVSQKYYSPKGDLIYATNPEVKSVFGTAIKAATSGISAKQSSFSPCWGTAMVNGDFATMAAPGWMLGVVKGR